MPCSQNCYIGRHLEAVCTISLISNSKMRCATSRTVPGSIPGGVTGFFSDISPSDRSMALGSTEPLVKMSTGNILGVKIGRAHV
jgi:hypothetical protein